MCEISIRFLRVSGPVVMFNLNMYRSYGFSFVLVSNGVNQHGERVFGIFPGRLTGSLPRPRSGGKNTCVDPPCCRVSCFGKFNKNGGGGDDGDLRFYILKLRDRNWLESWCNLH